jgi:hypothetical protein
MKKLITILFLTTVLNTIYAEKIKEYDELKALMEKEETDPAYKNMSPWNKPSVILANEIEDNLKENLIKQFANLYLKKFESTHSIGLYRTQYIYILPSTIAVLNPNSNEEVSSLVSVSNAEFFRGFFCEFRKNNQYYMKNSNILRWTLVNINNNSIISPYSFTTLKKVEEDKNGKLLFYVAIDKPVEALFDEVINFTIREDGIVTFENPAQFDKYKKYLTFFDKSVDNELNYLRALVKQKDDIKNKNKLSNVWVWYDTEIDDNYNLYKTTKYYPDEYVFWKDRKSIFVTENRYWIKDKTKNYGYGHIAKYIAVYRYGLIGLDGKEIIPPVLDKISDFYKGKARIQAGNNQGWVSLNGKVEWDNGKDVVAEVSNIIKTTLLTEDEKLKFYRKERGFRVSENNRLGGNSLEMVRGDTMEKDGGYSTGIFENGKEKIVGNAEPFPNDY